MKNHGRRASDDGIRHPSACYREPARPETNLQAAAGPQLHFRLVKVCPCVRVSDATRPLSGECRIRRVSTGRSASMAQGHCFKSEWPSEALSDARRPHSVDLAGAKKLE